MEQNVSVRANEKRQTRINWPSCSRIWQIGWSEEYRWYVMLPRTGVCMQWGKASMLLFLFFFAIDMFLVLRSRVTVFCKE